MHRKTDELNKVEIKNVTFDEKEYDVLKEVSAKYELSVHDFLILAASFFDTQMST